MAQNILITGAAGYIGGSVSADFQSRSGGPIKLAKTFAAVRSREQVDAVSQLGINVIQLDLYNENDVLESILSNDIDIVVHAASSIVTALAVNLIKALGKRREISGKKTYFVHSSVATVFAQEAGWPYGQARDDDASLFDREKQLAAERHPVRETNIAVVEQGVANGVATFNVALPTVYGRGTGAVRKLSVSIPAYVRISIRQHIVHKFAIEGNPPGIHISDLTELYARMVEKMMEQESIPSGDKGYYFAMAHRVPWWRTMDSLAEQLHERGLVVEPSPRVWPTYEMAADCLGFPTKYVFAMTSSTGDLVAANGSRIGWQPKWDQQQFLESLGQEIQDVLDLDKVQPSVFDTLLSSS